jgi:hypothetical protein
MLKYWSVQVVCSSNRVQMLNVVLIIAAVQKGQGKGKKEK